MIGTSVYKIKKKKKKKLGKTQNNGTLRFLRLTIGISAQEIKNKYEQELK